MNVSAISQNQHNAGGASAAGKSGPVNGFALLLAALGGQSGDAAGPGSGTAGLQVALLQGQSTPAAGQSGALPGLSQVELDGEVTLPTLLASDEAAEQEDARGGLLALFAQNAAKFGQKEPSDTGSLPSLAMRQNGAAEPGQIPSAGALNDLAERLLPAFDEAADAIDPARPAALPGTSDPLADSNLLAGRLDQAGLGQLSTQATAQQAGNAAPTRPAPGRSPQAGIAQGLPAAPIGGAADIFAELSISDELAALKTLADVRPAEGQLPTAGSGQSFQENLAQAQVLGRQLTAQAGNGRQGPGNKAAGAGQNPAAQQGAAGRSEEAIAGRSVAPEPVAATERSIAPARFLPAEVMMLNAAGLGGSDSLSSGLTFDTGASLQGGSAGAKGAEAVQAAQSRAALPDAGAQLAIQIQRAINNQTQRFSIRLEPAELGRVDVKLDFRRDGTVRAAVLVERPETLDLFQKDSQALERALKAHAAEPEKLSLDFGLQGEAQQNGGQQARENASDGAAPSIEGSDETAEPSPADAPLEVLLDGLVDIRV